MHTTPPLPAVCSTLPPPKSHCTDVTSPPNPRNVLATGNRKKSDVCLSVCVCMHFLCARSHLGVQIARGPSRLCNQRAPTHTHTHAQEGRGCGLRKAACSGRCPVFGLDTFCNPMASSSHTCSSTSRFSQATTGVCMPKWKRKYDLKTKKQKTAGVSCVVFERANLTPLPF